MVGRVEMLSSSSSPSSSPRPVLSMPASNQGWPEDFGFQLGGSGPSYILWVEEGSSAHLAGLQAGDQVLEIEGHNVSTLAPQAVIAIAQTQKNIPPSIGVVSRIQQVQFSSPPVPAAHVFICSCIHLFIYSSAHVSQGAVQV